MSKNKIAFTILSTFLIEILSFFLLAASIDTNISGAQFYAMSFFLLLDFILYIHLVYYKTDPFKAGHIYYILAIASTIIAGCIGGYGESFIACNNGSKTMFLFITIAFVNIFMNASLLNIFAGLVNGEEWKQEKERMNVITKEEVDFIVFLLIIVGSVVLAIAAIFVTDIMPLLLFILWYLFIIASILIYMMIRKFVWGDNND